MRPQRKGVGSTAEPLGVAVMLVGWVMLMVGMTLFFNVIEIKGPTVGSAYVGHIKKRPRKVSLGRFFPR